MTDLRPLVTYPDVERMAVDHLDADTGYMVGIGLPEDWTKGDGVYVQVSLDGTPVDLHPIAQRSTLRVTVWADGPSEAKEVANEAHGYLLARSEYLPGTGLFVTHDQDHDAELASFTVRATVRSYEITGS